MNHPHHRRAQLRLRNLRRGITLVEVAIGGMITSMLTVSVASISVMVGRTHKSIFYQQRSLWDAKKVTETINREIRMATTPLRVADSNGTTTPQGNRVEFSRLNENVIRAIELLPGEDNDFLTPWDNRLVFDPDIATGGDEVEIARGISSVDPAGAFAYAGATTPLVVRLRTGDPVGEVDVQVAYIADTKSGRGSQGADINITVAPRN